MTENPNLRGRLLLHRVEKRTLDATGKTTREIEYLDKCQDAFLGDDIIADGLISQNDFAEAYSKFCLTYGDQDWCPGSVFQKLPKSLQSLFYEAVCASMRDPDKCLTSLNTLPMVVGYIVSSEVMDDVKVHVQGMCVGMMDQVFSPDPVSLPSVLPSESFHPVSADSEAVPVPAPIPGGDDFDQALDLTGVDQNGAQGDNGGISLVAGSDPSFSHAPIIGIAAIASVCLLVAAYILYRRRKVSLFDKNLNEINSVNRNIRGKELEASEYGPEKIATNNRYQSSHLSAEEANTSMEAVIKNATLSSRGFGNRFESSRKNPTSDQIEEAVDFGNWDSVYRIASKLAEQEDLSTLSSAGHKPTHLSIRRLERRSILGAEDRERARTLDELITNGDWTGAAVTAALYAGESGYPKRSKLPGRTLMARVSGRSSSEAAITAISVQRPHLYTYAIDVTSETSNDEYSTGVERTEHSLLQLKQRMDEAVDVGDWEKVLLISSQVESHAAYQHRLDVQTFNAIEGLPLTGDKATYKDITPYHTLLEQMDRAVAADDWTQVGVFAEKLHETKVWYSGSDLVSTSNAIVPLSQPRSAYIEVAPSATLSKKTTLEKLVLAENWKGVRVMAGLYVMEEQGAFSPTPLV